MPLVIVPPPVPPDPPKVWPKVPTPPGKRIVWISPDGDEFPLTDGDTYISVTGRAGFGRVVPDLVTEGTASGAARLADYRDSPRLMSIPLIVEGEEPGRYLEAHRALVASTRHRRPGHVAMGRIRVELPSGQWREIPAVYHGGLDPSEDELDDLIWSRQEHPSLEFYAPDPYFVGPEQSLVWRLASERRAFFPIYPIRVASSQVGGDATITSPGDADSYPVWEITGPGTPVITNATTGQTWGFSADVPPGETVTIDCRPPDIAPTSGLTAVDTAGADWWSAFEGFPDLWSIPPGRTRLVATMIGATSDSRLRVSFRPRYLAGW